MRRSHSLILNLIACALLFCSPLAASDRVALVWGNSQYLKADTLTSPANDSANDAHAIAGKLHLLGFSVIEKTDLSKWAMKQSISQFGNRLYSSSVAVFYYAGYGLQVNGTNYLIPVDADIGKPSQIEREGLNLDFVLNAMQQAHAKLNIVILDACRSNPFQRSLRIEQGLAPMDGGETTLLAYAAEPNALAENGPGERSPYTAALLDNLAKPGLSVQDMLLSHVGPEVEMATKGRQRPWISSAEIPAFCFAGCDPQETQSLLLAARAEQIKEAVEGTDFNALQDLVLLSGQQQKTLRGIFEHYPTLKASVSRLSPPKGGSSASVLLRLENAVTRSGALVIPSAGWRSQNFKLRPLN